VKKPTSSDVAQRAGVSQSAVSRTFTPGASVSPQTRRRVMEAAEALGYRPNALARSLISGRSRLIGILMASLENEYFRVLLERLSKALAERGYHSLIILASSSAKAEHVFVDELIDYQVDGIVVGSMPLSDRCAQRCERANLPVVLFDRHQPEPGLTSVMFDNRNGGAQVADHLVATGCRRIAHLTARQINTAGRDRAVGFLERLKALGHDPFAVVDTDGRPDAAIEATRALFADESNRPDALFCGNDAMAFRVIDALRYDLGLRVPADVSVIGFDDVPTASWPTFDLTTVRQDVDTLVVATVEALLARIDHREVPPLTYLECSLVLRGTTRPLEPEAH
jgi:DNA-binding LacI/PurR family transcriptional regulator